MSLASERHSLAHLTLQPMVCHRSPMLQTETLEIRKIKEQAQGHLLVSGGVEVQIQVPDSGLYLFIFLYRTEDCSRCLLIEHCKEIITKQFFPLPETQVLPPLTLVKAPLCSLLPPPLQEQPGCSRPVPSAQTLPLVLILTFPGLCCPWILPLHLPQLLLNATPAYRYIVRA